MQWEYRVVILTGLLKEQIEIEINALGEEGWELVGVDDEYYAYFKRPKPAQSTEPPCRICRGRLGWEEEDQGQWVPCVVCPEGKAEYERIRRLQQMPMPSTSVPKLVLPVGEQ